MPALTFDTRPPVSFGGLEQDVMELIHLWLREYFDGAAHAIEASDAEAGSPTFPLCDLLHGVAALPKNSATPTIHTVSFGNDPVRAWRGAGQTKRRERALTWTHYVRVAHQGTTEQRATFACRGIADLLRLLYESSPALRLERKGLRRVQIQSGPLEVPMAGYSLRQMTIRARTIVGQTLPTVG